MSDWTSMLQQLADDPDDFQQEGGLVCFERHGDLVELRVEYLAGAGDVVRVSDAETKPIRSYVQSELLELPRLASQVTRTLDKVAKGRPAPFVDSPAEVTRKESRKVDAVAPALRKLLLELEKGTTRVVQLMAPAGQGKTVLLEQLAKELSEGYVPNEYPQPILLPVDLLGRYVGTIDDAIAGSLNNTYSAPGLSQRDVATAIRERWLVLALDGFDELVARVGVREGFLRVAELLEQLNGSGTVILSARESFFELHQIVSGIRSYLQPRRGAYDTVTVKLLCWQRAQGVDIFHKLGSTKAEDDLSGLLGAFEDDDKIVLHPFFLTRLASYWLKGERFEGAKGITDAQRRTQYVIETFVTREAQTKWTDRAGRPLLSPEKHNRMLEAVAEEMWRSAAFELRQGELVIAAEIGLGELDLPSGLCRDVLDRVPTHGAFISTKGSYRFLHDRFLHYYLAMRLAALIGTQDATTVRALLEPRHLAPVIAEHVAWVLIERSIPVADSLNVLNRMCSVTQDGYVQSNAGALAAALVSRSQAKGVTMVGYLFTGDSLQGLVVSNAIFEDCRFWCAGWVGTKFDNCVFRRCKVGDVRINKQTNLIGCVFPNTTIDSVVVDEDRSLYDPSEIWELLSDMGATTVEQEEVLQVPPQIPHDVLRVVERMVRQSDRTTDFVVEDLSGDGRIIDAVVKIGMDNEMLKRVNRSASGPKKTFVRFDVDRGRVLRGQAEATGVREIDGFWRRMRERFGE